MLYYNMAQSLVQLQQFFQNGAFFFFKEVSTILQLHIIKQVQHALLESVVTLATQQASLRGGEGGC